jgi:hypothetical protein
MRKVFGIGVFKTGLTSLGRALELLGYRIALEEWYHGKIVDDPWAVRSAVSAEDLATIVARAHEYDAHVDYPWMFRFREMDAIFPDAHFIHTVREPENVARSHQNHRRANGTREEDIPSKERIIGRYLDHGELVLQHFRGRQNLLVMNIEAGAGWETICGFLDKPIPAAPFPWANRGKYP